MMPGPLFTLAICITARKYINANMPGMHVCSGCPSIAMCPCLHLPGSPPKILFSALRPSPAALSLIHSDFILLSNPFEEQHFTTSLKCWTLLENCSYGFATVCMPNILVIPTLWCWLNLRLWSTLNGSTSIIWHSSATLHQSRVDCEFLCAVCRLSPVAQVGVNQVSWQHDT